MLGIEQALAGALQQGNVPVGLRCGGIEVARGLVDQETCLEESPCAMHGIEVRAQKILMQGVEANETDDQRDAADRRRDVGQDQGP